MLPTVPGEHHGAMTGRAVARRGAWTRRFGAPLVALVVVLGGVATRPGPGPVLAQEEPAGPESIDAATLREEYEALVGEEADLLVEYDLSEARLVELTAQVAEAGEAQEQAEAALVDAEAALEDRRDEEAEAEAALARARRRVAEAEDDVRRFAVGAYIGDGAAGDLQSLLALLGGEDGSVARRGYRTSFDEQRREVIDALTEARAERGRLRREAGAATRRAEEQRDDVEALRQEAAEALDEATRLAREAAEERDRQALLILDIQSRRVSIEARIVSLDKAADGIQAVLAAFQADHPDWVPGSLEFQMPVPCAEIGSEFGMRAHPILNVTRLHAGADIGVPTGTPVQASADGVVVLAEARGGYGNTVVIAHANSLGTVYAHNSELRVQVGQLVNRGDVIALAGSTGLSTGPHVHWETRLKGVPVNPRNFLYPSDGGTGMEPPPPPPDPDAAFATTTTTEPEPEC